MSYASLLQDGKKDVDLKVDNLEISETLTSPNISSTTATVSDILTVGTISAQDAGFSVGITSASFNTGTYPWGGHTEQIIASCGPLPTGGFFSFGSTPNLASGGAPFISSGVIHGAIVVDYVPSNQPLYIDINKMSADGLTTTFVGRLYIGEDLKNDLNTSFNTAFAAREYLQCVVNTGNISTGACVSIMITYD